eukprot:10859219-Lingulodinium_polyedra.AAC.1
MTPWYPVSVILTANSNIYRRASTPEERLGDYTPRSELVVARSCLSPGYRRVERACQCAQLA